MCLHSGTQVCSVTSSRHHRHTCTCTVIIWQLCLLMSHAGSTGAQGGSNISNSELRPWIRKQLEAHAAPGELAYLMKRFEEEKWELDYTDKDASITLRGKDPRTNIILTSHRVKAACAKAFSAGLQALKEAVRILLALGKDFVVIFCGGSYCNPGLRRTITAYMEKVQGSARREGSQVRFRFLANYDSSWYVFCPDLSRSAANMR